MIQTGIKPTKRDYRDFSHVRTFGASSVAILPSEYTCDAGFSFPNQNADGLAQGCSGYTQSELCQDQDFAQYDPRFTYTKTLYMDNQSFGQPCDLRTSLKSTVVYGVLGKGETTDAEASQHRRGSYFNVTDGPGDPFDDVRVALWDSRFDKRAVSVGSPWYPNFGAVGPDGILSIPPEWNPDKAHASWHNWKCPGWKTINGIPYLMVKSWQGPECGDKGWLYMSRELFNKLMKIEGSVSFIVAQYDPKNIITIQWDIALILQVIGNYFKRLFNLQK